MDPGENGAILNAGEGGGPGTTRGEGTDSWHQTVEEVKRSQDAGRHEGWARYNIKPPLCTEYVSYVYCVQ
jgi:hypothetical protein